MQRKLLTTLFTLFVLLMSSCTSGSDDDNSSSNELSSNACPILGLNAKIISGTECDEGNSAVVRLAITLQNGQSAICTGTMLTSDDVLTAAHCFFDPVASVRVSAGSASTFAERVISHPQASVDPQTGSVSNDVAIVQLSSELNLPTLPLIGSRAVVVGDIVSIFGYGLDENGNLNTLRSGEMKVSALSPNHIFARFNGSGSNTCNGDSGGPAIFTFATETGQLIDGVVGVTSSGEIVSCEAGDTTLFANAQTTSIFDFIVANVPDVSVQ